MTSLPSNHPDYARANRLARLFNLTIEEYDYILAYQRGACAICKKPPKQGGNRLSVDHHHANGLVRGLVCWSCNSAIAKLKDDLQLAINIAEYLANPPAVTALGAPRYGRTGSVTRRSSPRKTKKQTAARKKGSTRPKKRG